MGYDDQTAPLDIGEEGVVVSSTSAAAGYRGSGSSRDRDRDRDRDMGSDSSDIGRDGGACAVLFTSGSSGGSKGVPFTEGE